MKNIKKTRKINLAKYSKMELENKYIEDISKLENKNIELVSENIELAKKLEWYEEQLRLSKKKQFGKSSEKIDPNQTSLFNEAELENDCMPITAEPEIEEIKYKRKKRQGKREEIIEKLPVETVEYKLTEEEKKCPECGEERHEMSKKIRRELTVIPAQVRIKEHVSYVYSCRNCEKHGITANVVTAKQPNAVIKGSMTSPSFMSYVMTKKYVEAVPLYRQEQTYKNFGIDLSRQTLSNWMIKGAQNWLKIIYKHMQKELVKNEVLHADETVLEVLCEPNKKAETNSYMWMYRTGKHDKPIILYDYQEGRTGIYAKQFLKGFKGYLHVDGYAGYNRLVAKKEEKEAKLPIEVDAKLVGCWAHARRKYDEAIKSAPPGAKLTNSASQEGLKYCNKLFELERKYEKLTCEERYKKRKEFSKLIVDNYFKWVKEQEMKCLPTSGIGGAIRYSINQEAKLKMFLEDGRLEISNNIAERAIKPFVIGRKNWLFSNTPSGAQSSAIIYSIVETAKANQLVPFYYLNYLFKKLPNIDLSDSKELEKLLPWSDTLPDNCKTLK